MMVSPYTPLTKFQTSVLVSAYPLFPHIKKRYIVHAVIFFCQIISQMKHVFKV